MQNREALKKDFIGWLTMNINDDYPADRIADWWLKKIAERDEELVKKIEGMGIDVVVSEESFDHDDNNMINGRINGYNEAKQDIIKLIKG